MKVYQINEKFNVPAFIGAFIMVDDSDVKEWGVTGFMHVVQDREHSSKAWVRVNHSCIDYIGQPVLIPDAKRTIN